MAITVPQVQAKVAQFRAPNYETQDVLGAFAEGRAQRIKGQQADIDDALQSSLGKRAMQGSADALNQIAQMPGGGYKAAAALQGVVASNNKAASDAASAEILKRGRIYQAIRQEPDEKKRRALFKKFAINQLKDGEEVEEAEETMNAAQEEDVLDMDSELEYGINLAAASDKYLQGIQEQIYGDTVKIREENRMGIQKSQKGLNARIDALETAYEKVDSLVDQAKAGNRTAISSVLVGLVKLQDPNSAVLMAEMEGAINTANPLAAALEYAKGNKTAEEAIKSAFAKIDPLNPDLIDADMIRSTAGALVKANILPMQKAYENDLQRSQLLSKKGARSAMHGNFGERLFAMNNQFMTAKDDQNGMRLSYAEINQQREQVGLEPLTVPAERTFFVANAKNSDGKDTMQGLTEKEWNERQELLKLQSE